VPGTRYRELAALGAAVVSAVLLAGAVIVAGCTAVGTGRAVSQNQPLLGTTDWIQWERQQGWEGAFTGACQPDPDALRQIARSVVQHNSRFVLVGGTWSDDCRREMPRIHDVMRGAGVGPEHIRIIAIDQSMADPTNAAQSHSVVAVPTLIMIRNGMEVGRITGKPVLSWEQDICAILQAR
jgi:hypothetical protein